ncbi:type IV pilus secretin PilQ [Suttonella ornithocola]|uniref:Type IV pilus biogenesis and competence protein pilQ n=1 Tax=Suttonella ornithocola TaxID=279832 RepID=A0A380MYD3_9GAMM|nr:type IV pilus secretin PilQ [Suttonella ornithocola]SUO97298.1 Type IV pilus biogenesis and competence protein pilQ precursor [Suttonella ornithocola]
MKKVLCLSILLATSGSFAAAISSVTTAVNAQGDYQIIFKNASVTPSVFNTNSPAGIVLDFPNTTSALKSRETDINQNGIYSVNVIQGDNKTRAVVNLALPTKYTVNLVGKDVYVTVPQIQQTVGKNNFSVPATAQPVKLNVSSTITNNSSYKNNKIQTASVPDLAPMFHKNGKNGGVLSFTLPDNDALVSVKTEGSNIVATIANYMVPKSGQKRLDVADYGSPVRYVDITRKGADTRLTVNMGRNAYEYVTYQNGNTYSIEVKKPSEDEAARKVRELSGFGSDKVYTGAPLSLNFQDIEVRAVLQIIAEFTNNNIVVSDSVTGNITLRLDNVPWDQALDIIMKTKGLAMRKVDKVIYIAPESELNDMEIKALQAYREKQFLQPSHTELIQLKYAKASDIAKIIEDSKKSISASTDGNSMKTSEDTILSAKGSIAVDARTNTLLVNDIPSRIQAVRDLVAKLDEPVRQVMVDSRLVITTDNYQRDLGTRFGVTFQRGDVTGSGTLNYAGHYNGTGDEATLAERLGVNLPAQSRVTPGSYGISILGSDVLVDLELQAMQAEGRSEIISSPRVVTQDGYKALVAAGQEIPYTSVSDNGTQTSFKDAKLSMEVTPRIAPNDRVSMEIHITKDRADYANTVNGEPPIDTNEIQTKVEVENGETIVLGGIYEQEQGTSVNKVPLLGDIPVLGHAFKNTNKVFTKNELLVFITPRIIDRKLTDTDKFSNLRE